MIDIEKTINLRGYDPIMLTPGSNKKVWSICNECSKGRWITFRLYCNLCRLCSLRTLKARKAAKIKSIKQWSNQNNRDIQSKRVIQYNKDHPEICDINSKKAIKRWSNQNERNIQSDRIKNSNLAKIAQEKQRGGQDLVKHHYIYDHNDLSKYTTIMTRSNHTKLHRAMKKMKIKIPHINEI